ncbi:transporter substrate-binding domain-containing protein [uncultured Paracoccus sp.]|uniref:transporter substrate-binding domain-containing protein n=1 Tax=uncultured Paracoccus sp. TaxID=189685 RepID=UPI0025DC2BEA|nr:transporter substrate-binding domain-containing protein [uncultured Paracoccus sp.]
MLVKTTLTAMAAVMALSATADARSLEEAKASGKLIVGIQADNCPWGCLSSTGEAQGFDAEIARAFAAHLGLEAEFVPMAVANRIPGLTTDKVDVLIASLGITAERANSVQFSHPYAENTLYVTAPKDAALPDLASLEGKRVGVPRSTPMDTILTAEAPSGTNLQRFDDDASNIQALVSGQVEAVGSNQFYMQRLEAARPGVYEDKFPIGALYQGIATRLGEADWNTAANEFLAAYVGSEQYNANYESILQVDVPTLPDSIDGVSFTVAQQ